MKVFFDTAVLIAASDLKHEHFRPSRYVYVAANRKTAACGAHSLSEMYAVLTRLPKHARRSPAEALLILEEVRERVEPVALMADEHFSVIAKLAGQGLSGGIIRCAAASVCSQDRSRADLHVE